MPHRVTTLNRQGVGEATRCAAADVISARGYGRWSGCWRGAGVQQIEGADHRTWKSYLQIIICGTGRRPEIIEPIGPRYCLPRTKWLQTWWAVALSSSRSGFSSPRLSRQPTFTLMSTPLTKPRRRSSGGIFLFPDLSKVAGLWVSCDLTLACKKS
jgi:hypothetical protein